MRFSNLVEQGVNNQQDKDPVENDPRVKRIQDEVQRLQQQLADKKAELNQTKARIAQKQAREHATRAAKMDNT